MATKRRKSRRSCKHGKLKRPVRTKKGRKRRCKKSNRKTKRKKQRKKQRKSFRMDRNSMSKMEKRMSQHPKQNKNKNKKNRREEEWRTSKKNRSKRLKQKRIKKPMVLSVRPNIFGIFSAQNAPSGVSYLYKEPDGNLIYNPNGVGWGIKRREAEEYHENYENIPIDSSEVSFVIFGHGVASSTGIPITRPPNVKIYTPLKCLSIPWIGEDDSIKKNCPSFEHFNESYILTKFDEIPEVLIGPQEGELSREFVAGVYKCTESNFFNHTPVINIDQVYSLSEIIVQLNKMNPDKIINIILDTCLSFGDTELIQQTILDIQQKERELLEAKHELERKNEALRQGKYTYLRIGDKVNIKDPKNSRVVGKGTITNYDPVREMYEVELYGTIQILYQPQENLERIE